MAESIHRSPQRRPQQRPPRIMTIADERPPTTQALLWGHLKSMTIALARFALKHSHLALLINLFQHSWNARSFLVSARRSRIDRDRLGTLGVMHLAFAVLSGLTLRDRKRSTEQSALLVLTIAAMGQVWSHTTTWPKAPFTMQLGPLVDSLVLGVTAMALYQAEGPHI
ncbi:hypothetical protein CLU79DRAFT_735418 [Phycomyces nitens]|nr:hypothetical protein CLU79DRAFT_735418 [Phycomyces nitens]